MRKPTILLTLSLAALMVVSSFAEVSGAVPTAGGKLRAAARAGTDRSLRWAAGEVLVRFRSDVARVAERDVHSELGARIVERIPSLEIDRVRLPEGTPVREGLRSYAANPEVALAEPNYLMRPAEHVPNDEHFDGQWGLRNTGQPHPMTFSNKEIRGTPGADISVTEAWDIERGDPGTIIAVLDDGVNVGHPDLAGNVWTNPDEIPDNDIDDDDNGYIDDVHGWDFENNDNTVEHNDGGVGGYHGTHVAGIATAVSDNDTGISGVCPRCTLMPLKFDYSLAGELEALDYARRMGADIVNGSYGGAPWSRLEYSAFRALRLQDVLAVMAAGNASADNDAPLMTRRRGRVGVSYRMYPASYGLPHILSVAASDHDDQYASSSWCEESGIPHWRCLFTSWGAESVDLAAPGADVLSTFPNAGYEALDGTSMATPHVAGVAGLVKSRHPDWSALDIKNAIMNSVDRPSELETLPRFPSGPEPGHFTRTNGRLNALNALDGDTTEATTPTNGTLVGAGWINHSRRGSIAWPEDPLDVFKKRLFAGYRYKVGLKVPAGRDYRLFAWSPGIKEIWQIEGGCFENLAVPGYEQDGCKLVGWSDHRSGGRDETVSFKAPRTGVHHFLVNPWLKSAGNYELGIAGIRSISIKAGPLRVPRSRPTRISGKASHPDCMANQIVRLQSRIPGGKFRSIKKTRTGDNGRYAFSGLRIKRTKYYRAMAPDTAGCTRAVSRSIKIRVRT